MIFMKTTVDGIDTYAMNHNTTFYKKPLLKTFDIDYQNLDISLFVNNNIFRGYVFNFMCSLLYNKITTNIENLYIEVKNSTYKTIFLENIFDYIQDDYELSKILYRYWSDTNISSVEITNLYSFIITSSYYQKEKSFIICNNVVFAKLYEKIENYKKEYIDYKSFLGTKNVIFVDRKP